MVEHRIGHLEASLTEQEQITIDFQGNLVTFVHAQSLYPQRKILWNDLETLNPQKTPWAVIGDFDAYLSPSEKKGGRYPSQAAMDNHRKALDDNQLVEAVHSGVTYTWWNKHLGRNKIIGKLDRMLINQKWLIVHTGWAYKALNWLTSNHSPLIGWNYNIPKPRNVPFRFIKMWCSHDNFKEMVKENWHVPIEGNPFFIMIQKLKRLKQALKIWNKKTFGHLQTNIKVKTQLLENLQIQLDTDYENEGLAQQVEQ
ncbi:hypothetical protein IFM89_011317 [Coptis chinensis]|uniref:Uncharacterized protein n=1 Tax=Coptis chinensis TaxID=261450 RepID=A0A835HSA4_9MAGN|nr:hypothetical protein IFM89_011317 [Coptis chinensis]